MKSTAAKTPQQLIQEFVMIKQRGAKVSTNENAAEINVDTAKSLIKRCSNMEFTLKEMNHNLNIMSTIFIPNIINANSSNCTTPVDMHIVRPATPTPPITPTNSPTQTGIIQRAAGSGYRAASMINRRTSIRQYR